MSEKTILEVANEIHISKQRLYRYIRNNMPDVHPIDGVIFVDDAMEKLIRTEFLQNAASHHDVHHNADIDLLIEALKQRIEDQQLQLSVKDKQIELLQQALAQSQQALIQQQQLHQTDQIKTLQLTDGNKTHWLWPFKKREKPPA